VLKKDSSDPLGCHDSEESAQAQMRALYANEPDARSAGQWQALYGSVVQPNVWRVVIGPWGSAPERGFDDLTYLGEPIELLRQLYRYRLSLAHEGATLDYVAGVLASELHISRAELDALIAAGERMTLPSPGWCNFAQSCLFGIGDPTQWTASREAPR
jgi:hypothetical protein